MNTEQGMPDVEGTNHRNGPGHRHGRRSWRAILSDPEMLLALSAVFISLCAMVLSAVQVIIMRDEQQIMREEQQIMREEQHMAVWPRLELEVTTRLIDPDIQSLEDSTVVRVQIALHNKGVGPALVGEARTSVDGKPAAEFTQALDQVLPSKSFGGSFAQITDRTMLPGDSLNVALFYAFASERQVRRGLNRLGLQICYCSVYKDCWTVTKTQMGYGKGFKSIYRHAGCRAE